MLSLISMILKHIEGILSNFKHFKQFFSFIYNKQILVSEIFI